MAFLAEEVVEEWLNRQGFFTIRGIRLGVDEMDILAIRPDGKGGHDCRHVEVTVSTNPVAHISKVPKAIQRERGIGPDHAGARAPEMIEQGVAEWVEKKFKSERKARLRQALFPGSWSFELVANVVRYPKELDYFRDAGVVIRFLKDILCEMESATYPVSCAAGAALVDLMKLSAKLKSSTP